MPKRPNTTAEQGSAFEAEVAYLLRLMGYTVTRDHLLAGTQTDLLATKPDFLSNVALIVECTDRRGGVGVPLLKEKAAILLSYKDPRHVYRLLFVSRHGFSKEARAYAADSPLIQLMTPDELERALIDFRPYEDWYVAAYEASAGMFDEGRLFGNYVELTGRDDRGTVIPSLTDYLLRWLARKNEHLLFILGEFGSGKTSFCRHFVYESLIQRARTTGAPLPPLPLLINLREFRSGTLNLKQVIVATLADKYSVVVRGSVALERLASTGRLILVLDGFDEMADKADRRTLFDCLGQIHLLAALQTKIILTCRSSFFQSHGDIVEAFREISIELPAADTTEPPRRISLERRGSTIHVQQLSSRQIEQFVRNRAGRDADSILEKIRNVHDLTDLSTRPVLLDMIVSTIPQLVETDRPINSAALYEHYTDRWTSRDKWRVAIPLEVRREFSDSLGWHLYLKDQQEIQFPILEQLMTAALQEIAGSTDELERFKNDIQTCSFLSRSGTGSEFRFAHKSFMEFFVARNIVERLSRKVPATSDPPTDSVDLPSREVDAGTRRASWPEPPLPGNRLREFTRMEIPEPIFLYPSFVPLDFGTSMFGLNMKFPQVWIQTKWPTPSGDVLARHLNSRMQDRFDQHWPDQADNPPVSSEIATFAIEYASNYGYSFADLAKATTEPELLTYLSDIFARTRETGPLRVDAEAIKKRIHESDSAWVKVTLSVALMRVPDILDANAMQQLQHELPKAGWSYCLYLLARQEGVAAKDLLRACLTMPLSAMDRFICAEAVYGLDDDAIDALVKSQDETEQMLIVQLCRDATIDQRSAMRLIVRLIKETTSEDVRAAAAKAMGSSTSKDARLMLRALAQSEQNPAVRKQLREAERHARDTASRERNRPARPRERGQFLDLLWNRLGSSN